jgi:hypothetical protein
MCSESWEVEDDNGSHVHSTAGAFGGFSLPFLLCWLLSSLIVSHPAAEPGRGKRKLEQVGLAAIAIGFTTCAGLAINGLLSREHWLALEVLVIGVPLSAGLMIGGTVVGLIDVVLRKHFLDQVGLRYHGGAGNGR